MLSVCDLLEEDGYRPVRMGSGAAALAHLRSPCPRPGVILLVLMMPEMNGWAFREEQLDRVWGLALDDEGNAYVAGEQAIGSGSRAWMAAVTP